MVLQSTIPNPFEICITMWESLLVKKPTPSVALYIQFDHFKTLDLLTEQHRDTCNHFIFYSIKRMNGTLVI